MFFNLIEAKKVKIIFVLGVPKVGGGRTKLSYLFLHRGLHNKVTNFQVSVAKDFLSKGQKTNGRGVQPPPPMGERAG